MVSNVSMAPFRTFILAMLIFGPGCGETIEPREVREPSDPLKRAYVVLVQQTMDSETAFVVLVPQGEKTPKDALLTIAKELHATRGERDRTTVAFRDEIQWRPGPALHLDSQYSHAVAIAIIEPRLDRAEIRFGVFN